MLGGECGYERGDKMSGKSYRSQATQEGARVSCIPVCLIMKMYEMVYKDCPTHRNTGIIY